MTTSREIPQDLGWSLERAEFGEGIGLPVPPSPLGILGFLVLPFYRQECRNHSNVPTSLKSDVEKPGTSGGDALGFGAKLYDFKLILP